MRIKIRNVYLLKEFAINLFFAFALFSFLFSMRTFLKIFEVLVQETFSPLQVTLLFILTFVTTFSYIIPLSFLYSSMALFARLSMDRELLVFSSSGIAPLKLTRPLLLCSVVATVFLVLFNLYLMPGASYQQRTIIQTLKFKNPLALLQEKNVISDIPGITIYLGKIHRGFRVENISITHTEEKKINFLKAEKGSLLYDREKNTLVFKLENGCLVSQYSTDSISSLNFKNYTFTFSLPSYFKQNVLEPKMSEKTLITLLSHYGFEEKLELHKRFILGITPIFFIFLGSGLGRRVQQKSKILHIGLGCIIGILFFQLLFIGELFARKVNYPTLIWIVPIVLVTAVLPLWKRKC